MGFFKKILPKKKVEEYKEEKKDDDLNFEFTEEQLKEVGGNMTPEEFEAIVRAGREAAKKEEEILKR